MAKYEQATPYQGPYLKYEDIAEYEQATSYQGSSLNIEDIAEYEQADQEEVRRQATF